MRADASTVRGAFRAALDAGEARSNVSRGVESARRFYVLSRQQLLTNVRLYAGRPGHGGAAPLVPLMARIMVGWIERWKSIPVASTFTFALAAPGAIMLVSNEPSLAMM